MRLVFLRELLNPVVVRFPGPLHRFQQAPRASSDGAGRRRASSSIAGPLTRALPDLAWYPGRGSKTRFEPPGGFEYPLRHSDQLFAREMASRAGSLGRDWNPPIVLSPRHGPGTLSYGLEHLRPTAGSTCRNPPTNLLPRTVRPRDLPSKPSRSTPSSREGSGRLDTGFRHPSRRALSLTLSRAGTS